MPRKSHIVLSLFCIQRFIGSDRLVRIAMCANVKGKIDSWKSCLRSHGFSASERRLNCICLLLLENDFESIDDMKGARHPAVWHGAHEIFEGAPNSSDDRLHLCFLA